MIPQTSIVFPLPGSPRIQSSRPCSQTRHSSKSRLSSTQRYESSSRPPFCFLDSPFVEAGIRRIQLPQIFLVLGIQLTSFLLLRYIGKLLCVQGNLRRLFEATPQQRQLELLGQSSLFALNAVEFLGPAVVIDGPPKEVLRANRDKSVEWTVPGSQ